MGIGTPAQQSLATKFFDPFFNWDDDDKLREWLRKQNPDELEQFLNWFDFSSRRDRLTLGRQELAKLRNRSIGPQHTEKRSDVLILRPTIWGVGIDLPEAWRRVRSYLKSRHTLWPEMKLFRDIDVFYRPTVTRSAPPEWTPLIAMRQWVAQEGWNMDPKTGHNDANEITDRLRQAAVDKTLSFRGRRFRGTEWPEESKAQEPLVDIQATRFEDHQINPLSFIGASTNYFIITDKMGKPKDYRDLHVNTQQALAWLRQQKPGPDI